MKMPIENLQSLIRCPVCDKKYRPAKMLVLDEDDKRTTLHLTCADCAATTMVSVTLGPLGVVGLGTLTDLTQGEARQMFQGEAVSSDQVIDVHQFLKGYRGGVEELI